MFRIVLIAILSYLVFRLFKPLLSPTPENPHVKGNKGDKDNLQKKYRSRIEDADFEDID